MLAQRHARGRNGLPLGRRSCDGARVTSSVSTVATLVAGPTYDRRSRGRRCKVSMKCCSATLLGPSSTRDRWTDADQPRRARWAA
eukprot:scaffold76753_cov30-Phaeocystis_antarctica.AAC.1